MAAINARTALREISQRYFFLVTRLIAFVFPPRHWYRALFAVCRLQHHLLRPLLLLPPYRGDPKRRVGLTWLVESSLLHLLSLGRPFPIPMRQRGLQWIREARTSPKGVVLCSVHLPFARIILRLLVESGLPPTAVVAHETAIVDGEFPVWGTTEKLPGLVSDRDVLLKARTILRKGGFVAALIDSNLGNQPNRNVFRLIRSVGARLVFFVTELQPDGTILIDILQPPDPFCESDESVLSNIAFMQERVDRVLRLPSSRLDTDTPALKPETPQTKRANLEFDSSS